MKPGAAVAGGNLTAVKKKSLCIQTCALRRFVRSECLRRLDTFMNLYIGLLPRETRLKILLGCKMKVFSLNRQPMN